jgi:hypothetical protein
MKTSSTRILQLLEKHPLFRFIEVAELETKIYTDEETTVGQPETRGVGHARSLAPWHAAIKEEPTARTALTVVTRL